MVFVLVVAAVSTYLAARNARKALIQLMEKDAVSLANIFIEGARAVYSLQSHEILSTRFRLADYAKAFLKAPPTAQTLPVEVPLVVRLNAAGDVIDTIGAVNPRRSQWISLLPSIVAPVVEGEESSLYFGLDPEFPLGAEPMGLAVRTNDTITVLFVESPFPKNIGIGILARQLAETPAVRYIIIQNRRGIVVASKDVYRATSVESDRFLLGVLESKAPRTRFADFQGEKVFELACPFPRLGEFSGILRIGLPLSEYRDISSAVWWTVGVGCGLALLVVLATIILGALMSKILSLRQEHQRLSHLRSLGEIAAAVAHEIRNPLNAVAISLQRIEAEFEPKGDADEFRSILKTARSQIRRIDGIVQEFIAVAGNVSPVRSQGSFSDFARSVCDFAQSIARGKGVTVECDIQRDLPLLALDWEKLRRAADNVVKNAFEATPQGGKIKLTAKVDKGKLVLAVFNTGKHIPDDLLPRIFEPFTSGKGKGTGVGLFYAYRIVEAHGGSIRAENVEGGVKFTIEIPVSPPARR